MNASAADGPALELTSGARAADGHLTVHRDEISAVLGHPTDGAACAVIDAEGRHLGLGLYAARGRVACRLYTRSRRPIDARLITRRIAAAVDLRAALGLPNKETNAYRLVFGEGDALPGVVVDRYGSYAVLQLQSKVAGALRSFVLPALGAALAPKAICERGSGRRRAADDGDADGVRWHLGEAPGEVVVRELGLRYHTDLSRAMKTGHFCDQRENRRLCRSVARGRRVLDLFCYTGGFSLNAAAGGAESVIAIDRAEPALATVRRNARTNGFAERIEARAGDGFRALADGAPRGAFDLIVLDPPSLASGGRSREAAARQYRALNEQALRALSAGGLLLSCSCTYQISAARLREIIREAAGAARASIRFLAVRGQPADHPIHQDVPETAYLKSFLVYVAERFG